MRCGKCGNENAEGNRFCGMCGAALLAKPAAAGATSAPAPAGSVAGAPRQAVAAVTPAQSVAKDTARTEPHPAPLTVADDGPVITGPSFLGLNMPPSRARTGDSHGSHDSLHGSSDNLDYLLEDEEEPKRGWGKIILLVVALALAAGLGYLRWKQGGFDWLNSVGKRPAVQSSSNSGQSAGDSGNTTTTPGTAADAGIPQGASGNNAGPAPENTAASPAGSGAPQPVPPQNASQDAQSSSATPTSPTSPTASQSSAPQPNDSSAAQDSSSQAAESAADEQSAPKESAARKAVARRDATKPSAVKPSPARLFDPVPEAERYIYGRGVRQDCDHGLRLLKPAAAQSNPAAMISLGALYSAGTCTPRDLPTAYRWFALALHKQPDNQRLQDDLQKLWSQMTQPERQLAIKLSQ